MGSTVEPWELLVLRGNIENSINLSNVLENANTRIIEGKKVETLEKRDQFLLKDNDSSQDN